MTAPIEYYRAQSKDGVSRLKAHLEQGKSVFFFSGRKTHYLKVDDQRITKIHTSEIGLVEELMQEHDIHINSLRPNGHQCLGDYEYLFEWVLAKK